MNNEILLPKKPEKLTTMDINTILERNPEMVFSEMDGEIVMMSIENSEYYGLDPIASRIWQLLEKPSSVAHLADILLEEYEVDRETCLKDVLDFSGELLQKKIIRIQESADPAQNRD